MTNDRIKAAINLDPTDPVARAAAEREEARRSTREEQPMTTRETYRNTLNGNLYDSERDVLAIGTDSEGVLERDSMHPEVSGRVLDTTGNYYGPASLWALVVDNGEERWVPVEEVE